MRVFLTGAASPLGRALIEILRQRGDAVVGQVRRRGGVSVLRKLGAEPVSSDLTRYRVLADAMSGCDLVIHLAQFFDFWAPRPLMFHAVNVYGTENTLAAAAEAGVRRVVHTSTSLTIGEQPGYWGTERTRHRGWTLTAFERSKLAAEQSVMRHRTRKLEVVVVNPGLVVASGDPGWLGRQIADFASGRRRTASDVPMGWISAQDAATGIALAGERGVDGARYILSGDTLTPLEFFGRVTKMAGQRPPVAARKRAMMATAALSSAAAAIFGGRPRVPMDEARFASTGFRVDGSHACLALGVHYTPVARYLPSIVASYRATARFASA
ncbi:MAG TPA: NAD-dependent epimerase/dehydratase family protein [Gemmatimonadaceae bacterium]